MIRFYEGSGASGFKLLDKHRAADGWEKVAFNAAR